MKRWIFSDLHLGHKNINKFRDTDGLSSEEQNEETFEALCSLSKRSLCFVLGDFCFTKHWLERVEREVRCSLYVVGGNHCLDFRAYNRDKYHSLRGLAKRSGTWLSHAPIHPMELRWCTNTHGHTHYQLMLDEEGLPDPRYINVCQEYTGVKPLTWEFVHSQEYQEECFLKWKDYRLLNKCI